MTPKTNSQYVTDVPRVIHVGVVSPDPGLASTLSTVLGAEYHTETITADAQLDHQGLHAAGRYQALILDFDSASRRQDQWSHLWGTAASAYKNVPIILLANDESRMDALDLVGRGAYGCIRKPFIVREVKAMLRNAGETQSRREDAGLSGSQPGGLTGLDHLIGSSAAMQHVYKLIRKVTNLEASVFITGESGTGKELVAQAIHNVGNRATRPFVAVSCGAIPDTLIEAELFGHEKGAFTGTVGTREGYFEQAGSGTLFLDEIGELKPQTQVKLLRVLQQREFSRLGSNRPIPLRARIVLATHRNLSQMVSAGEFREDLFYRINVMNIAAPALRDHASDIPQLVDFLISKYSKLFDKPIEGIDRDALALLEDYAWPGNVRELDNIVQRAIIMAESDTIQASDLPDSFRESELAADDDEPPSGSFDHLVRDFKIKVANDAIAQCNGSKTLAAQSLSISRAYLHRLIRNRAAVVETMPPPRRMELLEIG